MKLYKLLVLLIWLSMAIMTSGCATTARGVNTDFAIQTQQDGVGILLDLETPESRKTIDWRDRRDASQNANPMPVLISSSANGPLQSKYSTKHTFSVLAYKEGYVPQIYEITHIHKKELERLVKTGAVVGTTATVGGFGVATGTAWGSSAASMGGAASVAGPAIVIGFPVMIFMIGANEVDKDNMANYDFYPNPLIIKLAPLGADDPKVTREQIIAQYKKHRIDAALDPHHTGLCYYKKNRMSCRQLEKLEKRIADAKRRAGS